MSEPGCAPFAPSQNIICTALPAKELSCRAGGKLIEVFARSPEGDNITASCTPTPPPPSPHSGSLPLIPFSPTASVELAVHSSETLQIYRTRPIISITPALGGIQTRRQADRGDGCEEHQHLHSLAWPTASAKKKKTTEKYKRRKKKTT